MKFILFLAAAAVGAHGRQHKSSPRQAALEMRAPNQHEQSPLGSQHAISPSKHRMALKCTTNGNCYADIAIGTPPQKFSMVLDTFSANTWVVSNTCQTRTCRTHRRYRNYRSSTYVDGEKEIEIPYSEDFTLEGLVANDTFALGDGLEITDQPFAEIVDGLNTRHTSQGYDGVLGIGREAFAVENLTTPLQRLAESESLTKTIFAVYFSPVESKGGAVSFGGVEKTRHQDKIRWMDVNSDKYWQVALNSVGYNNTDFFFGFDGAIFDTAYPYVGVPPGTVTDLYEVMGLTDMGEDHIIDCDERHSLRQVVFDLEGEDYILDPDEYVAEMQGECTLLIRERDVDSSEIAVLGLPFLRKYYTAFDFGALQPKIGLAEARHG